MKKLFIYLFIGILSIGMVNATPVNKKTAQKVALNFFKHNAPSNRTSFSIQKDIVNEYKGISTFYTFTFKEGGFIIISADDAVVPVLGYSYKSTFKSNAEANAWLDSYNKEIKSIIDSRLDNSKTKIAWTNILNNQFAKAGKAVDPLVTTTWTQTQGFDALVPDGTPVGCVATSISQVMNYWQYPTTGTSWHSYVHPTYGSQSAYFFNTTYDWANMPTGSYGNSAAATLCYHVGVAVDMNYATDGSGAQTNDGCFVLANYFKYDQSIDYAVKANYATDSLWSNLLKSEIDASRPMVYSGSGSDGGHAFVCDGYDDNGKFHFNWGWGGYSDGYFTIGALNPGGSSFNETNAVVYNIKPASTGQDKFAWVKKSSNFPNASTYPGYIDAVDANVAWAIGRDGSGGSADFKTFSHTTNGGATWQSGSVTGFGTAFSMIKGIDALTAYVACYGTGTGNHIIKTVDGGNNWESVLQGAGSSSFFNVVHFFNANDGVVQGDPEGGDFEIYTTSDGGSNWARVDGANIPDPSTGEYGIVGLYTAIADTMWFTTNSGNVYKSIDKGHNWAKYEIYSTTSTTVNAYIAFSDNGQNGLVSSVDNSVYTQYVTTDGGETWSTLSYTGNFYTSGISAIPGTESSFISVGADYQTPAEGISISTDGGATWNEYANYYKNFQVTGIDMVSATKGFAGAFMGEYSGGMWVLGEYANAAPDFTANKTDICLNSDVAFTNGSNGEYTSLEWNFGDGATPQTSADANPTVSYSTDGAKTISLTLNTVNGAVTETKVNFINVFKAPTANFTTVVDPNNSKRITFTSTSTDVYSTSQYDWNMGNGSNLINKPSEITFMYPDFGAYDVTLTVTNADNCSDSYMKSITLVGINDNAISSVKLFPNPANDQLNISNVQNSIVEIYSIDGRLVKSELVSTKDARINVSSFAKGLYSVKISKDNKIISRLITIK